jgi:hypothetical protein
MLRGLNALWLLAAAVFCCQPAHAATLTYDVTLTPFCCGGGPEAGTGSFTITVPTVGTSGNLTQGAGLLSMNFYIDGLDFSLNSSSEIGYNYNGSQLVLNNIGYTGTIGNFELTGISLGGYYFGDNANGGYIYDTNGSLSIALAATPIPTGLPLLATGLSILGLLAFWRRKQIVGSSVTQFRSA